MSAVQDKYRKAVRRQSMLIWLECLASVLIVLAVFFNVVIGVTTVSGKSMQPTYENGELILFVRLVNDFDFGDIVDARMANGDEYIKRVIGLPGQTVDIHDGAVWIDGEKLEEDYTQGVTEPSGDKVDYPLTLGEEQYFILGDNRENSVDSRSIGPVYAAQIKGRILELSL